MVAQFLSALWIIVLDTGCFVILGMLLSGIAFELLERHRQVAAFSRTLSLKSLTAASFFGLALPICSCGVVPIVVGLRRGHGIPMGNLVPFLFNAPATSITTVILALAVFGWRFSLFYVAGGLFCGYALGLAFHLAEQCQGLGKAYLRSGCGRLGGEPASIRGGFLGRVLYWGFGVYGSRIAFDQIVGLCLSALMVVLVSVADLATALNGLPWLQAAFFLILLALPMYVCSIPAIVIGGTFALGGLRPELVWIFLMAGPVTNIGDMNVLRRQFGFRPTLLYITLVVVLVLAWSLVIRAGIPPGGIFAQAQNYFACNLPVDPCLELLKANGAGLSLPTAWWDILRYLGAPVYILLVLRGGLLAFREMIANPCGHCRHLQRDADLTFTSCDEPCWKRGTLAWVKANGGKLWGIAAVVLPLLVLGLRYFPASAAKAVAPEVQAEPAAPAVPTLPQTVRGYPLRFSFGPDDVLSFAFSGGPLQAGERVTSVMVHDAVTGSVVYTQLNLDLAVPNAPCLSYLAPGCGYPGRIDLPPGILTPGMYFLRLSDGPREIGDPIYFLVHPETAPPDQPVAVLLPTFTWQAYNDLGGRSFYSQGGPALSVVNLKRPLPAAGLHSPREASDALRAFTKDGRHYFVMDDVDLHQLPQLLDRTALLIILIHSEYWTSEMRATVESFLRRGGKVLILGGNTCWWKVRYDSSSEDVFRDIQSRDPAPSVRDKTGYWRSPSIDEPEERTFGLTFQGAGFPIKRVYPTYDAFAAAAKETDLTRQDYEQSGGMRVMNAGHPLFAGTGLKDGDLIGADLPLVDVEVDGIPLQPDGRPDYTAFPQALRPMLPLASGLASMNNGVVRSVLMAEFLYAGRGRVLNMGSVGWRSVFSGQHPLGLRIAKNAVDYMLAAPVPTPPAPWPWTTPSGDGS